MLSTLFTLIHDLWVWICFTLLILWMIPWFGVGIAVKSRHHPSCCCDRCDPDHQKSRRLGIPHH